MSLRSKDKSGHWETWPCHSSILAALSPVLRVALADHVVDEEVVIVSEVEGGALLNLLYTGSAQCSSRAVAGELWSAVAELGVEGAISLSKVLGEPQPAQHISLIVSSKGPIWGDDSEDLRFIVLHGELRSKQGALDVFLSLMTGATLKCKQFSCAKGKKLRSSECPPTLY